MFGKDMTDQEWIEYMEEHYIKNNENRHKIMKDLNVTESYFYKRNREFGIKREVTLSEVKRSEFKFDLISGQYKKGKIGLKK